MSPKNSLAICLLPLNVWAADIYVDGSAADGGNGSQGSPYNQLLDINESDGDTIYFKKGTTIGFTLAGGQAWAIDHDNVTVTTYGSGDMPVIDCGNSAISGWAEQSAQGLDGIYLSDYAGTAINGLAVDRVYAEHADSMDAIGEGQWYWNSASNTYHARDTDYTDGVYWNPADDSTSHSVARMGNNGCININGADNFTWTGPIKLEGGVYGIVGNASAESMDFITITDLYCNQLRVCLELKATSPYTISDVTVTRPYVTATPVDSIYFADQNFNGIGTFYRVTVQDGYFNDTGWLDIFDSYGFTRDQTAIALQNCQDCTVTGNTILNDYNGGIIFWNHSTVGTSGQQISNNIIRGVTQPIASGASLNAPNTGGNEIYDNNIQGCPWGWAIEINTLQSTNPSLIYGNDIAGCGTEVRAANNANTTAVKATWQITRYPAPEGYTMKPKKRR